jgi:hypothetical protein
VLGYAGYLPLTVLAVTITSVFTQLRTGLWAAKYGPNYYFYLAFSKPCG